MIGYIFRRSIILLWIICGIVLFTSLFIDDFHYIRYHDIKVISSKVIKERNQSCSHPDHAHYYERKINVKWQGYDAKGNKKVFEHKFDDEDGGDEGVKYSDFKKGYTKVHTVKSTILWLIFALLSVASFFSWITEDPTDYYYTEVKDIGEFKINLYYLIFVFSGYNKEILNKVADNMICEIKHLSYPKLIELPEIGDFFDRYKEELNKKK